MRRWMGFAFGASAPFLLGPASALAAERGLSDPVEAFTRGGVAMYPVLLLAVLGLAGALARLVALRRGRSVPEAWDASVRRALESGGPRAAAAVCRTEPGALARVYRALLSRADSPGRDLALAVENECARLRRELARRTRPVAAAAAAAPLAGLAGAVWTVARTLDRTAPYVDPARSRELAAGVAGALVPAALGLAAAAVLVLLLHWVRGRGEAVAREVELRALTFVREIHAQARASASVSPVTADDIETQTMHPPVGERPRE